MSIELTSEHFDLVMSFETYSGVRYKNLKFAQLVDAITAAMLGLDAPAAHQQNLPHFQHTGAPRDYRDYKYAVFYDVNNQVIVLGVPWVVPESIVETDDTPYVMTIYGATQLQVDSLRSMAVANGIENFTISRL